MLRLTVLTFTLLASCVTMAAPAAGNRRPSNENRTQQRGRVAERNLAVLDYNSWFENIRVKGAGSPYDTKALLYGTGISYEYVVLRPTWGYGLTGGIIQGFAVAGDASDPTSYYAKRVPLNIFRGGGRYFLRVNPRFDLGIASHILLALKSYPDYQNMSVEAPSGLMIGAFIDSRWRLDQHWELIQSMGTYSRGPSLAWRFGASFTF